MQTHRQPIGGKPARRRYGRRPGDIINPRVLGQHRRHRPRPPAHLNPLLQQRRRGHRLGGAGQQINIPQQPGHLLAENLPPLLRAQILGGGNEQPLLQPFPHRRIKLLPVLEQRIPVGGARLGHQYGVADGLRVLKQGQRYIHNFRPQFPQYANGLPGQVAHLGVQFRVKILPHHADTQPPQVGAQAGGVVRRGAVGAGRIQRVVAGDGVHRQSHILNGAGHRAGVIQAPGKGRQPGPADPPVSRFEAHNPAQRGGNADAAPRVAAHRNVALPGRRRRTAAPTGAAGNPLRVPGIVHMSVVVVFARRPVGQRMHIQLAQQNRPGLPETHGHRAVGIGNVGIVNARPGSSAHARGMEQVFEPHRNAMQRPPPVAPPDFLLRPPGRGPGGLRQQGNERVERRLRGLNPRQAGVNDFHRGHGPVAHQPGKLPGGHIMQFVRHIGSPSDGRTGAERRASDPFYPVCPA